MVSKAAKELLAGAKEAQAQFATAGNIQANRQATITPSDAEIERIVELVAANYPDARNHPPGYKGSHLEGEEQRPNVLLSFIQKGSDPGNLTVWYTGSVNAVGGMADFVDLL